MMAFTIINSTWAPDRGKSHIEYDENEVQGQVNVVITKLYPRKNETK